MVFSVACAERRSLSLAVCNRLGSFGQLAWSGRSGKPTYVFIDFRCFQAIVIVVETPFSHDVPSAILVSQNDETAATLASQTSLERVEFFAYVCITASYVRENAL